MYRRNHKDYTEIIKLLINLMDYILIGMKMDRRRVKELTRMVKKSENGLIGMKTDRRNQKDYTEIIKLLVNGRNLNYSFMIMDRRRVKEHTRLEDQMDFGLFGMRMDRRNVKGL